MVNNKKKTRTVIIRCDGDSRIGLGHIYRCLALADEFRRTYLWNVLFAIMTGKEGINLIKESDYLLKHKPNGIDENIWLDGIIKKESPVALVLDVRTDLSQAAVQRWRDSGVLVVTVDDCSPRRLASDIAIYPPIPQIHQLDWSTFTGELKAGWEWVLLRRQFAKRLMRKNNRKKRVLVTMGGSDPAGMTLKVVRALDSLRGNFSIDVILGSGFRFGRELNAILKRTFRHFNILCNVKNIAKVMRQADLAIASFGTTAYELAAVGIPSICLCLTDDHKESAQAFVDAGMAVSLEVYNKVSEQDIAENVNSLLEDKKRRLKMARMNLSKVDGKGAQRIAKIIKAGLEENSE